MTICALWHAAALPMAWSCSPSVRPPVAADAARSVLARCKAEAFAEAEDKRDEKLREIAAELKVIRQTLPSITTQLAIELGVTSRQLEHEAEHGRS